jgi:hypothetical protein
MTDTYDIWTGHTIRTYPAPVPFGFISPGFCADVLDDADNVITTTGPFSTDRAAFNAAIELAQVM